MARPDRVNLELLRYHRYRHQFFESDRRQVTIVIIGSTLAILASIRNDFVLLHDTGLLWVSLASRIVHLIVTMVLLVVLRRAKKPDKLDWVSSMWPILTAFYLIGTGAATRLPVGEVLGPIFANAAAITIFYFAQRGRLCGRVVANAIVSAHLLVLFWHPSSPVSKPLRTTGPVVVLLLNIIGIASVRSFKEQRRKRFDAERLERQARQELAVKNRELAQQKDNAEAMYRARTAFLAAMSHEFRTPMNSVIGLSELLVNAPMESKYREHARTIRDSASSLLALLNDVLDFAKIDAGKLELSPAPFDLRALLGSVLDMMRPTADASNIELSSQIAPELPECVMGDDTRLRQVLVNLFSNALKFTSKGSVRCVVTARALDNPRYEIGFSIEDTGVGMSPDVMARLFRPFEQGDSGVARRYGGTGLGLAITKQIVIAMGGDIHVESHVGKGSTFSFAVHLSATTPPEPLSAPPTVLASIRSRQSLAILVVDDLPINRTVARAMLERLGYEADFANGGREAIESATKKDYDVIFMDLQMPEMSGLEATKCITEKLANKRMPEVIAMTASVFEEDRAACRAAGMRDFIAKPIDLRKLEIVLERITGKREHLMTAPPDVASLDLTPLDKLRQLEALGNPGFVASLCQEFLVDTPMRIQRIKDAFGRRDLQELERDAHSLKSSSATLGAMDMSTLCASIEAAAHEGTTTEMTRLIEQVALELPRVELALKREGLA